jgi:hypothetical protein
MADKARKAMELQRARLLEQAKAIERDMAELDRITAKYNLVVSASGSKSKSGPDPKHQKKERKAAKGSIASLIKRYKAHKDSRYHKINYQTRLNYESLLKVILADCGDRKLADLKARDIQGFYEKWTERGEAMAKSLVTHLRMLCGFGATVLGDSECERLSVVMHKMRFKMSKPRKERLTAEQATAVRAMAHKMGMHSIALAQALQFELGLGQKDVIGEWVPASEPGMSDVTDGNEKWFRGLRWSEIDQNLILRHRKTGGGEIRANLRAAPMVMEELARFGDPLPASGPMIIREGEGLPYASHQFRRQWRMVANAAGVPDEVYNMDSRPRRADRRASPDVEVSRQDAQSAR